MTGDEAGPYFYDDRDNRVVAVTQWMMKATGGDIAAALVLAQVCWWSQPGLDGSPRTKFERDGHRWLVRTDDSPAWMDECHQTERQVRRIKRLLQDLGLVEVRKFKVRGAPTTAWRPTVQPASNQDPEVTRKRQVEVTPEGQIHGSDAQAAGRSDAAASEPISKEEKTCSREELSREEPPLSSATSRQPDDDRTSELALVDDSPVPDRSTDQARSDVDECCAHLAERVARHGASGAHPKVTARWRTDMRLLIDRGWLHDENAHPIPAAKVLASIDALFDQLAEPEGKGGFCWADQVRSPGALRDHWVQIADAFGRQTRSRRSVRERRIEAIPGGVDRFTEALGLTAAQQQHPSRSSSALNATASLRVIQGGELPL